MTELSAPAQAPATMLPAPLQRVVYILDVAERPGIANAIASVFAQRGLSMEAVMADAGRRPPRILVVFTATPRQCRMIERVLMRLHDVHAVRCVADDSPELHAVAFCKVRAQLPAFAGVTIHSGGAPDGATYLVTGTYRALQQALAQWQAAGLIVDMAQSLVAL